MGPDNWVDAMRRCQAAGEKTLCARGARVLGGRGGGTRQPERNNHTIEVTGEMQKDGTMTVPVRRQWPRKCAGVKGAACFPLVSLCVRARAYFAIPREARAVLIMWGRTISSPPPRDTMVARQQGTLPQAQLRPMADSLYRSGGRGSIVKQSPRIAALVVKWTLSAHMLGTCQNKTCWPASQTSGLHLSTSEGQFCWCFFTFAGVVPPPQKKRFF